MNIYNSGLNSFMYIVGQFCCCRLGASISVLRTKDIEHGDDTKQVAEVLVRKVPENQQVLSRSLSLYFLPVAIVTL